MTTPVVHIENATIRYGKRVAVDDVSLVVERASVYALLGRNGAGKSSLVRCLLGQVRQDRGTVELFGADAWRERTQLMLRTGVVSEESDAPPDSRVRDLASFSAHLYPQWQQESFDKRLARFGIAASARSGELSKGQKKQVALALALASAPELLILDDPTLGLDVVARQSLFEEVIADLADRGITVLITTHDLASVESIADRVGILKDGRLVLDEAAETLKARYRRVRVAGPAPLLAEKQLAVASTRAWGSGTEAVITNYDETALEGLCAESAPMSLEEIFIAVTGEGS
ncbi:MAG TPA: ABC transporter ATP-binding protein [Thermoanaerobaculia bacterium]|nr:ABC transporter ATP-binding protein [Thermoanaerobaculia bacterium]